MQLSIIIVNYNVKHFLEQTVRAALEACKGVQAEIFVVDNHSSDDSVSMIKTKFPEIILIENKDNPGFSKANNQAIKLAKGKYVLLLNPDTVVAEDTFQKCIATMEQDPAIGALGVRMIDGSGAFLPESKRSLPSPKVALYKITGLSSVFPHSEEFAKYHLGHIPSTQSAYIEILSGAFMFMRKEALDAIGYLDEDFFMYGEDIDLSYRFILAGYKNYYEAGTTIIHYKGESTKKGSLNYVKAFYEAMIIFAEKHFKKGSAGTFVAIMKGAIWIKALLTLIGNVLTRFNLFLIDFICSLLAIEFIKFQWAVNIKHQPTYYPPVFSYVIVPIYILFWLGMVYFNGGYDKPIKAYKIIRGTFWGTILIATFYAFLPENYRYSRAIILFGALATTLSMLLIRLVHNYLSNQRIQIDEQEENSVIIVGSAEEARRAIALLEETGIDINYLGRIGPASNDDALGSYGELVELAEIYKPEEIIFCTKDVHNKSVIEWMDDMNHRIHFKILHASGESLIGSNSKNTSGDLYAKEFNLRLNKNAAKRNKRVVDLMMSFIVLLLTPWILIRGKRKCFPLQVFSVMLGVRTFVGFFDAGEQHYLPKLRKGLLYPCYQQQSTLKQETQLHLNLIYAKNYKIADDIKYVASYLFK